MSDELKEQQFSNDAKESLADAESQEELYRLIVEQGKNQKEIEKNEDPFVQIAKKRQEIIDNERKEKQLIAENDRHQKALVDNNLNWSNYEIDLNRQISKDKDFSTNFATGSNSSSYSQNEIDAMRRKGLLAENNDAYILNEIERDEKWKSNALDNQIKANKSYDKIRLGTQHALNQLNINVNFQLEQLNKSENRLKQLYQDEIDKQQYIEEVFDDINKSFNLDSWKPNVKYTTDAMSRFGSGVVESFDEIIGASRILGYDDWRANPLQSLLETIGVMDKNKEYVSPYKSKVYNDFFKDTLSLSYLKHTLLAESGYTVGLLIQSALLGAVTGGAGAVARLGIANGLRQAKNVNGLLSKAKALSGELSKASKEALINGNKGQAKLFGLFNVVTDTAIGKVASHLATTQMALYPFRSASRIGDIAKDRLALEGKEYTGLSDLNSHDIAMGATSALMDSMEVPTALLGGALARKTANTLLKSEKTSSKIAGGLVALTSIPPTAFVTEGVTEAVSTIAEIAGTYGVDFSEVMSALWSNDPKDAEWKYAIQEAMTIGTAMGAGFAGIGATAQTISDVKQGVKERQQIAKLEEIRNTEINKGVGQYARDHQYTSKMNSFSSKIDEAVSAKKMSKEEAKSLKDTYFNQQKISASSKAFLDTKLGNKQVGLYSKLKNPNTTSEEKSQIKKEIRVAQKAYNLIDNMNNQIDKIADIAIKDGKVKQFKEAMSDFQKELNSNNIQLGNTGLSFNKSFIGGESTTMFSTMKDIFDKHNVMDKKSFGDLIKESMKETKDYSDNFFNKENTEKEVKPEDEVKVSRQKQQKEAEETLKQAVKKDNNIKDKKENAIQKAIKKQQKKQEVKSKEEEIAENNRAKDKQKKKEEEKKDRKIITSINNKLIGVSYNDNVKDEDIKNKLLDSAVYSNNETLSEQLIHFIKKYKSIHESSTDEDIDREFKDKLDIELTYDELSKIMDIINENALYTHSMSYNREVAILNKDGEIEQVVKENVSITDLKKLNQNLIQDIQKGITELHQEILDKKDTTELKQYIKNKIDDLNANLNISIDLATSSQITETNRNVVKSELINMVDKTNKIMNQYYKYSNMLNEEKVPEVLESLSEENLIAKIKNVLKRFSIALKKIIDNFDNFIKNSENIKEDIATLNNDIKEVLEPMDNVLKTISIIEDFKNAEDFVQWKNTKIYENDLSLSYTNQVIHNIRNYEKALKQNFDFSNKAIMNTIETVGSTILTNYYNDKKNGMKYRDLMNFMFGNNTSNILIELNKMGKNPTYENIKSVIKDKTIDNISTTLKALTISMIKIIGVERQSSKLFQVEDYKIIDNVQIEEALKNEFRELTGIDLSYNPKKVSLLLTLADTFMKQNQKIKDNYVSFTTSESAFNTAVTLSKIIDNIENIDNYQTTDNNGEKFLKNRNGFASMVISKIENQKQRSFLANELKKSEKMAESKQQKNSEFAYAIADYLKYGNIFDFAKRLQSVIYKNIKNQRTNPKVFLGLRREDSNLSPIINFMKISKENSEKSIYDILYKNIEDKRKDIAKANRKQYILNESKFRVFKEQFGEEAINLEEIKGLTEEGYELLLEDYMNNPPKEFERDNPFFYVPVRQYNDSGIDIGVKFYKLPDNPKLIEALSLDGVLKDFRNTNSLINSDELTENFISKLKSTMKDIGNLYALFEKGSKPFHMNYEFQETKRLYMTNTPFNILSNKLLREFISLNKMDIQKDNVDDYKGKEELNESHRELIKNPLILASLESSYDKTPFKVNENNEVVWIIKDKDGNDITEQKMKEIDDLTSSIIKKDKKALKKLDELISKQDDSFDFTDDGNTTLTNLLVIKNALKDGYIIPNDITLELDGLSTGISENIQYMNSSEKTAMITSTQKYFVTDNNKYSGYLSEASKAKAKLKEEPTFENIIKALSYDIYGSVMNELYNSLKGLNNNTGNIYLDTLTHIFTQSVDNPNKIHKQLRDLGKKLVLGPNYGQKFTSLIKSDSKDTIKDFILNESLKQFNSFIENKIKELKLENKNIGETIRGIVNSKIDSRDEFMKSILQNYLNSLKPDIAQKDFSENTIATFLLNIFRNEKQDKVIQFLANQFDINSMSEKDKAKITQKQLLKIEDIQNKVLPLIDKLEQEINEKRDEDSKIKFSSRNQIIKAFVKTNGNSAKELKELYIKNKILTLSTIDYYLSDSYKKSEGKNGFVIRSLSNFKEIGDFKDKVSQIKMKILTDTIRDIKNRTFKNIIWHNTYPLSQIISRITKRDRKEIENEIENLVKENGDISPYIPYLSYIKINERDEGLEGLYDRIDGLCELTYERINEFIGMEYGDESNIHMTFKKEGGNAKHKRTASTMVNTVLKETNQTLVDINVIKNPKTKEESTYSTSMQNINTLNEYMSFVVNLIEHDIEASIMNNIVLDDLISALFSIYDGIFVRSDKIKQTAEKWDFLLGQSRLVNKDYSTIASILRLDNMAGEYLNSINNIELILNRLIMSDEFKKYIEYNKHTDIILYKNSIFASSLAQKLFRIERDNQLLNNRFLNDIIIIEKDIDTDFFVIDKKFNGYKYLVVKKGTLDGLNNEDIKERNKHIENVLYGLYYMFNLGVFKGKDTISTNLINDLEKKYKNFLFDLLSSTNPNFVEFGKELESLEKDNNDFNMEIIPTVFSNSKILFKQLKGIENKTSYKELLLEAQRIMQYNNFYNIKDNINDETFNIDGTLFDFTSKNKPINMRVIGVKIENASDVKNKNAYDYSINQMTFKELKESKLINFLSKSTYLSIDKNILPLAMSKSHAIMYPNQIQEIEDNDIMLGRNFVIKMNDEDYASVFDEVFNKLLNDENYTLLDAYTHIHNATKENTIHFIPKTILSKRNIRMINQKEGKLLFDDFLSLVNSAMYNQSALLSEHFNTETFKQKNTKAPQGINYEDEFNMDYDYKLIENIDQELGLIEKKEEEIKEEASIDTVNLNNDENNDTANNIDNDENTPTVYKPRKKSSEVEDVSYQLRSGLKDNQATENILSYIDLNNPNNEIVETSEAIYSLNEYVNNLSDRQKELLSPLINEMSKQLPNTKIIMSNLLENANGVSFTYNGEKYIVLSNIGIQDNTLAHELGHTLLDSVFRNEDSMSSKNIVSDIKYLQSFILNEISNNGEILDELGLLYKGKKNNIFDEISKNANEFVMYFLFDKAKFDYLSNFSIGDLKSRNYKSKQSILGKIFHLMSIFIKKVTNLIALRNENPHNKLDEYLSSKVIKMSAYSDPKTAKELDNTFLNNIVDRLNNMTLTLFDKLPILKSFQDINKWATNNGYSEADVERIIDEIKQEFNKEDNNKLSYVINYDYSGIFKPLNILKIFNILNKKFYQSPLHMKVALMMLNRSLNMTNNFLAKEFGRILRDFGIISTDNQSEIESLLGQKLSLDQIKSKINNYISLTYDNAKKRLLKLNYEKLEQDEKEWIKPTEKDKYNLSHFSPKEMFERSLGSIIGEIQVGKGFNETENVYSSNISIKNAINHLFNTENDIVENINNSLSILKGELQSIVENIINNNKDLINSINPNDLTQNHIDILVRTMFRKTEILGFTRLTNQVSNSAIENQSEIVRQSDEWFKDIIENINGEDKVLILKLKNKLEQLTTYHAIKHIKTLADKDIEIGKYAKQIEFVKSYITEDNVIKEEQMNSLLIISSLHSSLVKEAQQYDIFIPNNKDLNKIESLKLELAEILNKKEHTKEDREKINKINSTIEDIIESNVYETNDFQQGNIFADYSRDGYTKYNYNPEVDIVTIQYNNPEMYDKEQIREYYRQITENNTIESFEDAINYYRELGYEMIENDGNIISDEKAIKKKIANKNNVSMIYKGKFGYKSKYIPYSFIGVKNKTSGSLLSENLSLNEEQKTAIQKSAFEKFKAEKKMIKENTNYSFEKDIYKSIKNNITDYRYSTNASIQLRTKQSKFMIEKITHLNNGLEQQLLALENVVFQKKNADRFNAKLALSILEDNKVIRSNPKELEFAKDNYIKIIDLEDKTVEDSNEIMFSKNIYRLLRRVLNEYNEDKVGQSKIKELYISPDNAEHLLGMSIDRLSTKITKNVNNGYVRKWLNRIEKLFDYFWNDVKETVIIRNPNVLYQNILSNFSTLTAFGLSPKQIAESSIAIEKDLELWEKDLQEYSIVQNKISILKNTPYSSKEQLSKLQRESDIIESRLINNRVFYPMMNGVDSNIVDETLINTNEIDNVLKTGLETIVKKAGLGGIIKENTINNIILSQSSDIYKKAMKFNRFGDIIPRIIAYEIFMNKENLDREKALQKSQDFFVNYNIPITSRFLQFFEKIGMQQFIRFNVKVQRASAMSFMNYPVSTLATLLSINTLQTVVPYGNILFVNPLSNESMINKEYNLFGMLGRNLHPFYRWTGFTDLLNGR